MLTLGHRGQTAKRNWQALKSPARARISLKNAESGAMCSWCWSGEGRRLTVFRDAEDCDDEAFAAARSISSRCGCRLHAAELSDFIRRSIAAAQGAAFPWKRLARPLGAGARSRRGGLSGYRAHLAIAEQGRRML